MNPVFRGSVALDYYGVEIPDLNAAVQPEYAYEDAE